MIVPVAVGPPSGRSTGLRRDIDAAILGLPGDSNRVKPNKHLRSQS
jgi:hypothetical protein